MGNDVTLASVFEGFQTESRTTAPKLAGWMRRIRLVVWPPACSQPRS